MCTVHSPTGARRSRRPTVHPDPSTVASRGQAPAFGDSIGPSRRKTGAVELQGLAKALHASKPAPKFLGSRQAANTTSQEAAGLPLMVFGILTFSAFGLINDYLRGLREDNQGCRQAPEQVDDITYFAQWASIDPEVVLLARQRAEAAFNPDLSFEHP